MRVGGTIGLAVGLLLCSLVGAEALSSSVVYQRKTVLGIPVNVVIVNLNDDEVKVTAAIARGGVGTSEPFVRLINRVHPAAAITGAFFDTRSLRPVGDIVVAGERVSQGGIGTGVCFTSDNRVCFVPMQSEAAQDWSSYQAVMCAGPWLVRDGMRWVRPWAEGYKDSSLYARRPRAAIGVTRQNKLLLVTVPKPVYYTHVSKIMKALGAVNALGLDGGSSVALSIRGRVINKPSRRLTNVLLVYDRPSNYERAVAMDRLVPRSMRARPPMPLESAPLPPMPVVTDPLWPPRPPAPPAPAPGAAAPADPRATAAPPATVQGDPDLVLSLEPVPTPGKNPPAQSGGTPSGGTAPNTPPAPADATPPPAG